jgi:amino acid adenylation domain-containing protein
VAELAPDRDLSYSPLFQVMFNMLNVAHGSVPEPLSNQEGRDADDPTPDATEAVELPINVAARFDLTLYAEERDGRIHLDLVYSTDLFDLETCSAMLSKLKRLLENIVRSPDERISYLGPASPDDPKRHVARSQPVVPHQRFVEFPSDAIHRSIPDRFRRQVENHGDRIAIEGDRFSWTYETLDKVARRIARSVVEACGPGASRVALVFERDPSMVAAILAVLGTGNAYVPLDPSYPMKRLGYIMQDSEPAILLTDSSNAETAAQLAQGAMKIIDVNQLDGNIEISEWPQVPSEVQAYILYTSGSTGQPKGVIQSHRNVLHFMRQYTNNLHISASDRLSLLASYSFDAGVMDIFAALLNGATLCPIEVRREGLHRVIELLRERRVTIYHSTPTLYRSLLDAFRNGEMLNDVRLVVLGGEAVFRKDFERYKLHFQDRCLFVNGFGPTESSVTLQQFLDVRSPQTSNAVPIGHPVGETEVLIVKDRDDLAGHYEFGEIAIRSPYVALGYWRRPDLTAEVFRTDPNTGAPTYLTGDLGRRLPDGRIEFVGRRDFQVKIRGFRIELAEIEAALEQHHAVENATVVTREDASGEPRLVAYFTVRQAPMPSAKDLRKFLKFQLPDYMIPAVFVELERLPLTPTGKLDRLALPPPATMPGDVAVRDAPRTALEEQLAQMWSEVLGLPGVGIHDEFFELGGHSLLATQLVSRIRDAFRVALPLASFFEHATLANIAELIAQVREQGKTIELQDIKPVERDRFRVTVAEKAAIPLLLWPNRWPALLPSTRAATADHRQRELSLPKTPSI